MVEMDKASSPPLFAQIRALRRLHVTFGGIFLTSSLILIAITSFSTQLFQEKPTQQKAFVKTTSYSNVDEAAPLPIILTKRDSETTPVQVKGIEITKINESGMLTSTDSVSASSTTSVLYTTQELNNEYLITLSWRIPKTTQPHYYIIYEKTNNGEKELFSNYGKDLEESTNNITVPKPINNLYLKVITIDKNNKQHIVVYKATLIHN